MYYKIANYKILALFCVLYIDYLVYYMDISFIPVNQFSICRNPKADTTIIYIYLYFTSDKETLSSIFKDTAVVKPEPRFKSKGICMYGYVMFKFFCVWC